MRVASSIRHHGSEISEKNKSATIVANVFRDTRGMSTLELLIALAIFALTMTAVIMVSFAGQSIGLDAETSKEALSDAHTQISAAQAHAQSDYAGVVPYSTVNGIYTESLTVQNLTQCLKQVSSNVAWQTESSLRPQSVTLTTILDDTQEAIGLGGDCDTQPPKIEVVPYPLDDQGTLFGKATGIDRIGIYGFLTLDQSPGLFYFYRYYQNNQPLKGASVFPNGFKLNSGANDIDAVYGDDGHFYLYVVTNTTSSQLNVIEDTNVNNPPQQGLQPAPTPVPLASLTLNGVNPNGSYPQGWRVFYYKHMVYVTTRETAGPEFHVFDVSNPSAPIEIGGGTELNTTVNSMAVSDREICTPTCATKRFAYLATSGASHELMVLDVTDPANVKEVTNASIDFPGSQNGQAVFLQGNQLFFGRDSNAGFDFYVLDASNPTAPLHGLPILGQADIGAGVTDMRLTGNIAYLITTKAAAPLQLWDVSDLQHITRIADANTTGIFNVLPRGIDEQNGVVYILDSNGNDILPFCSAKDQTVDCTQ